MIARITLIVPSLAAIAMLAWAHLVPIQPAVRLCFRHGMLAVAPPPGQPWSTQFAECRINKSTKQKDPT